MANQKPVAEVRIGHVKATIWLLLAEGHLNRRLFGDMLHRIWALPLPSG